VPRGGLSYDHRAAEPLLAALEPGGPLHGLTDLVLEGEDLDLGLRSRHATLYVGPTRAADVRVDPAGRFALRPQASASVAAAAGRLWNESWAAWQPPDALAEDWPAIERYLREAVAAAHTRYRRREGALQAWLARAPHEDFVVVDREAVIAFPSRQDKSAVLAQQRAPIDAAVAALRAEGHAWAAAPRRFGDEIDALAIDASGRVIVIEAKHAADTRGVTWAPAQVAVHLGLARRWAEQDTVVAADVLEAERDQRIRLGLLSPEARRFSVARPLELAPALVLGGAPSPAADQRMTQVAEAVTAAGADLSELAVVRIGAGSAGPRRAARRAAPAVVVRARAALARPLRHRGVALDADGRTERLDDNLAAPLSPRVRAQVEAELGRAAGSELRPSGGRRPRAHAAHSSAALAISAFAPFADEPALGGFTEVRFEARLPTGARGTPPHLDVLGERAHGRLAVESKCLEFLAPKTAEFSAAYATVARDMHPSWREVYEDAGRFALLDAAQLIKHYWGLRHTREHGTDELLYLFWEPLDAAAHPAFARHRGEVAAFAAALEDPHCRFTARSHPEQWAEWERAGGALAAHAAALRARYAVSL
jgi:hypothetical protein